jgi:hypothetical protein
VKVGLKVDCYHHDKPYSIDACTSWPSGHRRFIRAFFSHPESETGVPIMLVAEFWVKAHHLYGVAKRASGSKQNDRNDNRLE